MELWRKYNTSTTIYFPLITAGSADFITTAAHASGDTQIIKDGGAPANTTNGFTHEGNGIYSLVLTATEMQAAKVQVTVIDQGTKAYSDQAIILATYGNASAEFAFDLSVATQSVNVTQYGGVAGTFTSGRPEVNTTHAAGTAWNSGAIGAATLAADTLTAAKVAADVGTEIATAVWASGTRVLTAGTNIVLAKGTGVTGFNDLDAAGVAGAVWNAATATYGTAGTYGLLVETNLDAAITSRMATYTQPTGFLAATFPTGTIANTTNITAGTITTATNVTTVNGLAANVITAASTAADYVTEIQSGLSTLTAANVADAVWNAATASYGTAGTYGLVVETNLDAAVSSRMATYTQPTGFLAATFPTGTIANTTNITAGTITTATNVTTVNGLAANVITSASIAADAIGASEIAADAVTEIVSGVWEAATATYGGAGSYGALIETNLNATVSSRATQTSVDTIDDFIDTEVSAIKTATDKLDTAMELDGSVYRFTTNALEQAPSGGGSLTAQQVWEYDISAIATAGFAGTVLNGAGSAGDPWSTSLPGAYGAGTAGNIIGNNLNATISSRLASASYTAPLDAAGTRSAVGLSSANLDTQLSTIDTVVDSILVDTAEIGVAGAGLTNINLPNQTMDIVGNITGNISGSVGSVVGLNVSNLDATVSSRLASSSYTAPDNSGVAAIKAKTDSLTFTQAGIVDSNIQYVNDVEVTGTGAVGNEWGP
jgi:predicted Fe-Mo cluster-binding NifX family protein